MKHLDIETGTFVEDEKPDLLDRALDAVKEVVRKVAGKDEPKPSPDEPPKP